MELTQEKLTEQIDKHCENILNGIDENISLLKGPITNFYQKELLPYLTTLIKIEHSKVNEQELFDSSTDEIAKNGYILEQSIKSKHIIKEIKKDFRNLVGRWAYQSEIVKRAFEKPKGYPGDYELLEIIYNNTPVTQKNNKIGYCFDKFFLKNELAVAVRERKDKMKELLKVRLISSRNTGTNILNFASGSIREIRELLTELNIEKRVKFICVDLDEEALDYSKRLIKSQKNIEFSFLKEDIIKISLNNTQTIPIKNQDIIYSIGLIDYLPDRVMKSFISFSYNLLKPNGQFILSHKDQAKYNPLVQDWFCDWTFYRREKHRVVNLIEEAGIPSSMIKLVPLKTESVYYIIIDKE